MLKPYFASVHCCLAITFRQRVDLLALVCNVYCDFYFPIWYLIVSIPDPCCLSYFNYIVKLDISQYAGQKGTLHLYTEINLLIMWKMIGV